MFQRCITVDGVHQLGTTEEVLWSSSSTMTKASMGLFRAFVYAVEMHVFFVHFWGQCAFCSHSRFFDFCPIPLATPNDLVKCLFDPVSVDWKPQWFLSKRVCKNMGETDSSSLRLQLGGKVIPPFHKALRVPRKTIYKCNELN